MMFALMRRYLRAYRLRAVCALLAKMIEVIFELLTPVVVAAMIDAATSSTSLAVLIRYAVVLLVFALASWTSTLVCQRLAAYISQAIGTELRRDLFATAIDLSVEDAARFGPGALLTRITADVNHVQLACALGIRQLTRWPVLALGSLIAALSIDLELGSVFCICLPLVVGAFALVIRFSLPLLRRIQENLDRLFSLMRATLAGIRSVRAFLRAYYEHERFYAASCKQADLNTKQGRLFAVLSPASFLSMGIGLIAILLIGSARVHAGYITTGQLVAFVSYLTQLLTSISFLANFVMLFARAHASSERILELLDAPQQKSSDTLQISASCVSAPLCDEPHERNAADSSTANPYTADAPVLELVSLGFHYAGASRAALDNITLTLSQGATLGIIGGTGSGKSTLINLVAGLYEPTSGSIQLCGHPLATLDAQQRSRLVSLVPQNSGLMHGTIRSNLVWRDPEASEEALWHALTIAQADSFVRALPEGLDAPVERGGLNFSGGQRQRLCIARALVGTSRLLLLDDCTSALDFATESAFLAALAQQQGSCAQVIVSQRVRTLVSAERILVLDQGRCCALGTHAELLEHCEIYREICELQLGDVCEPQLGEPSEVSPYV